MASVPTMAANAMRSTPTSPWMRSRTTLAGQRHQDDHDAHGPDDVGDIATTADPRDRADRETGQGDRKRKPQPPRADEQRLPRRTGRRSWWELMRSFVRPRSTSRSIVGQRCHGIGARRADRPGRVR